MQFKKPVHLFLGADGLAHFEGNQLSDHPIAENHTDCESDHQRRDGAEGLVLQNIGQLGHQAVAGPYAHEVNPVVMIVYPI